MSWVVQHDTRRLNICIFEVCQLLLKILKLVDKFKYSGLCDCVCGIHWGTEKFLELAKSKETEVSDATSFIHL